MKIRFPIDNKLLIGQLERWEFFKNRPLPEKEFKVSSSITISRDPGCGGRLIAKLVAKKLKLPIFDKKIIELVAEHSKKRKDLIKSLDEQDRDLLEETVGSLFGSKPISSATYFRNLVRVILFLSRQGNCIILGRGANFIVPPKKSLRIKITSPLRTRIKNIMELNKKTTSQKIKQSLNKEYTIKKNYIKRYFGKDIANANYYDLVINTENFLPEQAAEVIIKTFKKRFFGDVAN